MGAAAGGVVREGSHQQICCYKLNAETTASAEVGKGWEIPNHALTFQRKQILVLLPEQLL